jgi:predicted amidophosphoribosyltransferase
MVGGALGQTSAGFTAGANAANANAAGVAGGARIKCEGCGAEIAANAKFCPECGAKNQPRVAETIVCPGCGMTVSKKKFCPECGQLLAEPVCPDCGAKVAANAKFCPECGKKMN